MASVSINVGPTIRHEAGGTIVLTDGTDDLVIKNIVPGTFRATPGQYAVIQIIDQGEHQPPIRGNSEMSKVNFSVWIGNDDTSAGLFAKLQATSSGATSLMWKEFGKLVFTAKDTDATGTTLPWSCKNVRVSAKPVRRAMAGQSDQMDFELESRDPEFQPTTTPT